MLLLYMVGSGVKRLGNVTLNLYIY